MPIKAVIFDMDGVLVNSEEYWLEERVAFARDLGKPWTMDDQKLAMGRATLEWAEVMKERLHIDWTVQAIADDMMRRIIARYDDKLPELPGAVDAVHTAASAYRVGLASGSPTPAIKEVMKLTELDKVFEVIIYGDDIPRGKPAPDIYLEAARQLGVAPAECIGIEDSANGLRSLKAAGMYAIAAPSPGFPLPDDVLALAEHVINGLAEFSVDLVRAIEQRSA
ncbi:MAG: HAD family phosphatase [Chloroflexi bacterium]|nr:HAD family phosphatase [Chloroflexota bacterium]